MATIATVRFGALDVPENEQVEFSRGLLGFENLKRFVHLEINDEFPFGWLQSLEDPQIAFVVANPALFFPQYRVDVDPRELGDVLPEPNEKLLVLGICTLPQTLKEVTMNLQGPLVINLSSRKGKQLVLNHSGYATAHRLTENSKPQVASQPQAARPHAARTMRATA
jgi:flagellar assembly factor FliW